MTARELIIDALTEIGILGAEEILDAADQATALRYLQQMIRRFQADRLLLYTVLRTLYVLTVNQQTRTIGLAGTGANFIGPRPLWVSHVGVIPVGADYEIEVLPYHDRDAWLGEPIKTLTDQYPSRYLYEPSGVDTGTFTFWPVPQTGATVAVSSPVPLQTPVDENTVLTFPDGGYEEAWRLNLAKRLQRPFMVPPDPELRDDARLALGALRRVNDGAPPYSRSDEAVTGGGGFDIRSNGYRGR